MSLEQLKKMSRAQIESKFNIIGKKGKEGTTFVTGPYAIKMFSASKSGGAIAKEAELQKMAAAKGV